MKHFLSLFIALVITAGSFAKTTYTNVDSEFSSQYITSTSVTNFGFRVADTYKYGTRFDRTIHLYVYNRTNDSHIYKYYSGSAPYYAYGHLDADSTLVNDLLLDTTVYVDDQTIYYEIPLENFIRSCYQQGNINLKVFYDIRSFDYGSYHTYENSGRHKFLDNAETTVPACMSNFFVTRYGTSISSHQHTTEQNNAYSQYVYYGDTVFCNLKVYAGTSIIYGMEVTSINANGDTIVADSVFARTISPITQLKSGINKEFVFTNDSFPGAHHIRMHSYTIRAAQKTISTNRVFYFWYPFTIKGILQRCVDKKKGFIPQINTTDSASFWGQPGDTVLLTSCGGDWALPTFSTPVEHGQLGGDTVWFRLPAAPLTVTSNATTTGCALPCGDSATYIYDSQTRHLQICGTGAATRSFVTGTEKALSVDIEDGITALGPNMFYRFRSLRELNIPNSVTSIGQAICMNCDSLERLTLSENLTTIPARAFWLSGNLDTVVVPDKVVSLDLGAFGHTRIKHIVLGRSLQSIGNVAFCCDSSLLTVTCRSIVPPTCYNNEISQCFLDIMDRVNNTVTLYVPCEGAESYNSSIWNTFSHIDAGNVYFDINLTATEGGTAVFDKRLTCDDRTAIIRAIPSAGYKFVQWNDGNTDNPRTVQGSFSIQNFEAQFEKTTALDQSDAESAPTKVFRNGNLYILRDGKVYDALGREIR